MSVADVRDLIGKEVAVLYMVGGNKRAVGSDGKWLLDRIEGDTIVVQRQSVIRIPLANIQSITALRRSM